MRRILTHWLLRLYPASWRAEYGEEFRTVIDARPLNLLTVADVAFAGLRERLRRTEPWKVVGTVAALLMTGQLLRSIVAPVPYEEHTRVGFGPALMAWAGCWSAIRGGYPVRSSLYSAMLMQTPTLIAGILIATGIAGQVVLGPGDLPTTWSEHGFALAVYSRDGRALSPVVTILLPILYAPTAILWGWLGGVLGRLIRRRRTAHV